MQQQPPATNRLAHFPVAFFAMVMGLAGLTIAWQKAQHVMRLDLHVNTLLLAATITAFVVLVTLYALKAARYGQQVLDELRHPVKLNFFPTLSISLLLLAIALLGTAPELSRPLWIGGALLHLAFTLYVAGAWMHQQHFQVQHLNPAWFIPAVGNVLVPIAGIPLGHDEISWFFFSVGMLFWLILMTNIFYRVIFHQPIDERLMPTLFILIAPPAVGFIAYTRLTGDLDSFARMLFHSGLFLTLLLLTQVPRFARLRFALSWWAYSFPLAAISIASLSMYEMTGTVAYAWIGAGVLALLSVLVLLLLALTARAVRRQGICLPGH